MSKPAVIISTNFDLTESQNFLRYSKTQNRLLSVAFLFHVLTAGLCLAALGAGHLFPAVSRYVGDAPLVGLLVATLMLIVGYTLGYSKICARKVPVNYICLLIFILGLVYTVAAADAAFLNQTLHIFLSMLLATAVVNLVYVNAIRDYYSGITGFLISFGVILMVFLGYGFYIGRDYLLLVTYLVFAALLSFLVCTGVERLMKNRDYYLLKDDYVLVALKIITVFPLVPHLIDEDRTGEED